MFTRPPYSYTTMKLAQPTSETKNIHQIMCYAVPTEATIYIKGGVFFWQLRSEDPHFAWVLIKLLEAIGARAGLTRWADGARL